MFFKDSISQNLVLDALHCGIIYAPKHNISVNFFAITVISNISAFIWYAQLEPHIYFSPNIHHFGKFCMILRNYSDVALPARGSLLFSARPLPGAISSFSLLRRVISLVSCPDLVWCPNGTHTTNIHQNDEYSQYTFCYDTPPSL